MVKRKTPEGYVKDAICQYLDLRGIRYFRMNAGLTVLKGAGGKYRAIKGHAPGTSDILAFPRVDHEPVPLWIEVKRENGGRVSDAQRDFLASVAAEGHHTLVATSTDAVQAKLREIGAI